MLVSTEDEESNLQIAIHLNEPRLVREALREGCDPNAVSQNGWTALHEAASMGNIECILLLLNAGANPNFQDAVKECTPLHLAAKNGRVEVVKLLLDNGAKFDLLNTERKTPIDVAENECRRFLESKRIESLLTSTSSINSPKSSNIHKMYRERRESANHMKRQTAENFAQSVSNSCSSDTGDSLIDGNEQQNPGDIKIWFEYNRTVHSLKIAVWEVRNLRVPFDHNFSHLYVKCYLLPDKNKATKRKTSLKKLGSLGLDSRSSSSSSGCSTVSEESDSAVERSFAGRVRASLSKRPHLHKRKNSDKVKCMVQHEEGDILGRITTPIQEAFLYDTLALSKVDMDTATVQLSVCGRNRRTAQAVPIATLSLPLAAGIKVTLAEYFPLEYKICLPTPPVMQENYATMVSNMSENDGGGRSSAWGHSVLSMSMPTVPTSTAASNASSASLATGRFKLFKKEKKLLKGRPNYRYKNQSSDNVANLLSEQVQSAVQNDRFCHSRLDGSPHNLQSRTPDLFMASIYRHQANNVQYHEAISSPSTSDKTNSSPRQLIYSRALMNDKKRASNSNDVIVEDFDQNDVIINTPVQLEKSFWTNRKSSMLAF